MLEVKNIYKSFGNTEVLKGINFTLNKGEVLAIIGSSGSGKTTLLRCLNFLELPDKGEIIHNGEKLFDAQNNKKITDEQIRQKRLHFGLVFQNFNLFPQYNVFDNICLAPKMLAKQSPDYNRDKVLINEKIEKKANELLARVGLTEKKNAYSCELSGGQQQRVAIARALAQNPDILCFDEPTSALDPELTGEVLRVIKGLKSFNSTMIVVTHEMDFAKSVADKIIFMADGIIEVEGTPTEVFGCTNNEKIKAFLSNQLIDI